MSSFLFSSHQYVHHQGWPCCLNYQFMAFPPVFWAASGFRQSGGLEGPVAWSDGLLLQSLGPPFEWKEKPTAGRSDPSRGDPLYAPNWKFAGCGSCQPAVLPQREPGPPPKPKPADRPEPAGQSKAPFKCSSGAKGLNSRPLTL